jgi:hypothetical protein
MAMAILVLGVLACLAAWIYGEATNTRWVRLLGAISCMLVFSVTAAGIGGLHAHFSMGIPLAEAFHRYLDAASEQLDAGNVEFVRHQFSKFSERAPATYETEELLRNIDAAADEMSGGPP